MGTTIDEVADLFLMLVSDYKINTVFETSGSSGLNTYLETWLLMSIDEFDNWCTQDLSYSTTTQSFTETLAARHKNILAQIMTKFWLQKQVQDVSQMNLFLQDRDFKTHAASANLKEKRALYDAKREEVSQLLLDYGIQNNDWDSWENQDFA